MAPITVTDLKVITVQPETQRLVVVKIETSEPGLYGLGCATFTQRFHAVVAALQGHLKPFMLGRDVERIEDSWNSLMVSGYWRNGPVLNNAIAGIDMALWDIKGKLANMPVYQLLGGKSREAAAVYVHAHGLTHEGVVENVQAMMEQGYRYIRAQLGFYGGHASRDVRPPGALAGAYFDPRDYMRRAVKMLETVRATVGDEVELLHDIHERLTPIDAVNMAKQVEPLNLFFLEDALAPEDVPWFEQIRAQCSTPLAMGELFVHPLEWRPLIEKRLIDFIRMHVSAIGGITPARNAAILAHTYGIRTAWHGPADVSPVGHAANLHLDLWAPNFGVQEWCRSPQLVYDLFPGCPEVRDGYMFSNDRPGLGVEIDEALCAKYPCQDFVEDWTQTRLPDGSPARP